MIDELCQLRIHIDEMAAANTREQRHHAYICAIKELNRLNQDTAFVLDVGDDSRRRGGNPPSFPSGEIYLHGPFNSTTIENAPSGYLLRCAHCEDTYLIETSSQGVPMWAFEALTKGFMHHHHDCEDPHVI